MTDQTSRVRPRQGFRCAWHDGNDRILVYCEICLNWSVHGATLGYSMGDITYRSAHCKLDRRHPNHCKGYSIRHSGDAPDALLDWLKNQEDWPKRPSDFGLLGATDD